MADKNQLNLLLQKAIGQVSQFKPVENTDLAQYILTHSYSGPSKTYSADLASKQGAASEGHSLLSKVFDSLSTGLYGTANVVNDTINAVKKTNADNQDASLPERLWNTLGKETGKIGESIAKNTVGTVARGAGDALDILGQVTGLDSAPVAGGLEHKAESGLQGVADKLTPRMMGSTILDKQFGIHNKLAKYGGGFAADVAMDPLTYVPGVDIFSTLKKAKEAKLAAQGLRTDEQIAAEASKPAAAQLDDAAAQEKTPGSSIIPTPQPVQPKINIPPAAEMAVGKSMIPAPGRQFIPPTPAPVVSDKPGLLQSILGQPAGQDLTDLQTLRRSDNATRAANVRWGKPIDWHDIPDMTPEEKGVFADQMREAKMAKKGVVSDGKGNISQRAATDVIQQIREGNIPRFGPQFPPAEGAAAERATSIAQRTVDNLAKPSRKGLSNKILTPADQTNMFNSVRNEAAKLVNEEFAARPARVLNPKQQGAFDSIKTWADQSGIKLDKPKLQKELDAQVKAKTISKADAKAIAREFFPPEKIHNFAVTRLGRQRVEELSQQMLRSAEDHAISLGVKPVFWNGMGVRLSEVLAEVGAPNASKYPKEIMEAFLNKDASKLTDPVVREAVTKALARRSLSMSDMLAGLSSKTQQMKDTVLDTYPNPVAKKILDSLPKQGADAAESIGATPVESRAMSEHIRSIIDSNRLPEERLFDKLGRETAQKLLDGKGTAEEIKKGNDLIGRMIEETPVQASKDVTGNKAIDGFFARTSTWYGRPEPIKRASQDAFLQAELNAGERGAFFRLQAMQYTPEELNRGFNLARHPENLQAVEMGMETDPQILGAASLFKNYFEWALGSTGFKDLTDLGGTVAVRSNMIMTDINRQLLASKSKFQFKDWKNTSIMIGDKKVPRDYSAKGVGWMQSWETHDPTHFNQDPLSFMYDIDLAMQRTVAEYATYDEFARRFGAQVGDAHYDPEIHKAIIPNPRLAGYRFHPEVQQQMLRLIKDMETGAWMPSSPMMRNVIKATRVWKSSVTIYRPVHHIRNVIGDAFNMWLAGYNNPTAFSRAIKVLETQKPRYAEALKSNSIDNLKALIDSSALDQMGLLKEVKASEAIIKKGATKLDSEQLWSSGYKRGLFLKYNKIEDLFGQTPMGTKYGTNPERSALDLLKAPFGGRAHSVATHISEHREHFVRMAHYIAAVEKKLPKGEVSQSQLNRIFDDAAHEVRKYHPDGSDMTQFEQKVRVVIPFYSWTRKEIPLLMQAMVERPAKLVAMPRAERAVAGASGINVNESQGMLDPYPNDQLFPDWIRASGIGPIGDPQSKNALARFWARFGAKTMGLNGPEGYVSINPSNPFQDVTSQLFGYGNPQDALRATVNSMNPGIQIPASLAFNQTFSGAPITKSSGGQGVMDYLSRQIPQWGEFSRLSGVGRNDKAQVIDRTKQNLWNFLTGAGILGSGPYQKSAEFEAKARAKNANSSK